MGRRVELLHGKSDHCWCLGELSKYLTELTKPTGAQWASLAELVAGMGNASRGFKHDVSTHASPAVMC